MKNIFKKKDLTGASARLSVKRSHPELGPIFDQVAYAAALEVLG